MEDLQFDATFDRKQARQMMQGFIPEAMEDKWFVYYADGWLKFHRSWTGILIYSLRLDESPAGVRVAESWVNREPEQYTETDTDRDRHLVRGLIDALLLKQDSPIAMKSLELKIPPPVVALLFALLMWLTPSLGPPLGMPAAIRIGLAIALAFVGQGISISGMVSFRRAKTTINPVNPSAASSLVSSGVFRLTRNPMYVGLLVTLLGWAVYLSNPLAFAALPLFALYIHRFQIVPEERVLFSLFGAEYAAYMGRVRRWL
jgi:protein-S-isoprenylcysteine O-methyltransferase Ste14